MTNRDLIKSTLYQVEILSQQGFKVKDCKAYFVNNELIIDIVTDGFQDTYKPWRNEIYFTDLINHPNAINLINYRIMRYSDDARKSNYAIC